MTPRDEHVEEYTPTAWERSYNGFSGVDFAVEKDGEIHPGMQIQGISLKLPDKTVKILFLKNSGDIEEGDIFHIILSAKNEYKHTMVQYLLRVEILEPVVTDKILQAKFETIVPWSKP